MDNKEPWYISFVTIIIAFICFWPIGCALLYIRWQKKSGTYTAITRTLIACTIVLILIGIVGMSEFSSSNDSSDLILAIFLFILLHPLIPYLLNCSFLQHILLVILLILDMQNLLLSLLLHPPLIILYSLNKILFYHLFYQF